MIAFFICYHMIHSTFKQDQINQISINQLLTIFHVFKNLCLIFSFFYLLS